MRIAVLDDYGSVAEGLTDWTRIGDRITFRFFPERMATADALTATLASFDAVVLTRERTAMPREVIERLPRLRLIVTTGKGNAALDMEAATAAGIQVCGTVTMGHPTSELTWALILAFMRRIPQAQRTLANGTWLPIMGESLSGKTLGIMGLGRIGSKVARVGKALDMDVVAWSQNLTNADAEAQSVRRVSREDLFGSSDILSIHVGLGRYRNSIGAAEFALMKPTALLVNTSRAGIVDEQALIAALKHSAIGGAAIDVYPSEPPPADYELLYLDNVLATPHLGYATRDNLAESYRQVVECIEGYLNRQLVRPLNEIA